MPNRPHAARACPKMPRKRRDRDAEACPPFMIPFCVVMTNLLKNSTPPCTFQVQGVSMNFDSSICPRLAIVLPDLLLKLPLNFLIGSGGRRRCIRRSGMGRCVHQAELLMKDIQSGSASPVATVLPLRPCSPNSRSLPILPVNFARHSRRIIRMGPLLPPPSRIVFRRPSTGRLLQLGQQ